MHTRPVVHRTVKPREYTTEFLPIIAYSNRDCIYRERTDSYHRASDIFALVVSEPRSIIVAHGMAVLLYNLHKQFHKDPLWQFACTPIDHRRYGPNRKPSKLSTVDIGVSFLGWKGAELPPGPRGGRRQGVSRYHSAIDPVTFTKRSLSEILSTEPPPLDDRAKFARNRDLAVTETQALYIWATQLRAFCLDNGLRLRATAGALAGQLLRDPRFYPNARRKVPYVINARAREQLPGNYYKLYEQEETRHDAYYLDQTSAHHSCARDLKFPSANKLYGKGHFKVLVDKPGLPDKVLTAYGLFYAKISVPHYPPGTFPPPFASEQGEHCAYFYSNELPMMKALGITILYVIAAWVSPVRDFGLNRYAKWCLAETARDERTRNWKKPLLLSTYGILAATPGIHRVGYAKAKGKLTTFGAGGHRLPVYEKQTTKTTEPGYANVIHRGMIEAECRLRSLGLARELFSQGHDIYAVYADSVFIMARDKDGLNRPLPIPPAGWTVEACLTELRFHNEVSFTSNQMQKLPGIPQRATVLRASFGARGPRDKPKTATIVG